jgi:phage FluMu protein Com
MEKQVQCPNCHHVLKVIGSQGETKKIKCPQCDTVGKVIFSSKSITTPAIQVNQLRKDYGSLTAVNSISFTVKKGEVFAF